MALPHVFHILPSRGEYYLMDKSEGSRANHVLFQCPLALGKGVLVSPTVHGNLIVGPNAVAAEDKTRVNTTGEGLEYVRSTAVKSVPSLNFPQLNSQFCRNAGQFWTRMTLFWRSMTALSIWPASNHRGFPRRRPLPKRRLPWCRRAECS